MSLANQLTVQTLKALSLNGYHVWRQNNGGVYDPVKKVFRRNSSTPGVSDIIGFHKKTGVFVAVEIKAGKDKLSPYQERFLADVKKAGGVAMVVRNMDDVEALYKSLIC
jgi:hypothetical protein